MPGQAGLSPHRPRRHLDQRDPGPHHLGQCVGRLPGPVLGQQLTQLGEGQRVLGGQDLARRGHCGQVHAGQALGEVAGQGPVQHRLDQRPQPQRVVRADQVDGAAHQRDPDHVPADQQLGQMLGAEPLQPGQQAVVGRERGLGLQADQVFHHGQRLTRVADGACGGDGACGRRLAGQQRLPGQQGPVQRAAAQNLGGHGILMVG
jgi:hypothetical protein